MLGLLFGRRLLGASRGIVMEPGVVHGVCMRVKKGLLGQWYRSSRVACPWSSYCGYSSDWA